MKTVILQFLVLFSTVSLARSLQLECLQCVSYKSWADCVSSGKNVQCPEGLSNCAKIQVGEAFTATCASPQLCENMCEDQEDCDIECCPDDLCNGGSEPEPEGSSAGEALTCLMCQSDSSMDDCTEHQTEQACPGESAEYRCGAISYRGHGLTAFGKGCIPEETCQAGCGEAVEEGADCELSCCSNNNCNA